MTDYIIIGAGSAGSVLAYRLGEAGYSVLVIEAGGTDAGPLIQMPGALSYPMNLSHYDWGYRSEPEPHLGGRKMHCPRGRVIGGSSSINGMVYVRGHAQDYDHWAEQGATGWDWRHVAPYFQRMEHWHSGGHGGDPAWRGRDGPLHVSRGRRENPLFHAFVEAGVQAGFERTEDYNGQQQEGFGPMEQTVWQGRRWSTANAYLRPALGRKSVRLMRAVAQKILFENGRATGVQVIRGGAVINLQARREIILSASSINSPKLLMLSGVGARAELEVHGIDVRVEREAVGKNLQDHLELYIQQACTQPITLYRYWNLPGKAWVGARWLFSRSGPGASNQFESAAFVRSKPGVQYPDIQYHFLPIAVRYDGQAAAEGHGFQAHVGPMRSGSRGQVSLRTRAPAAAPQIQFNYMSQAQDWSDFRHCIRLTRELFAQSPFDAYRGAEIQPGAAVQSDDELDDFIRQNVESAYHPCGTCRMGAADDPASVVDPECRVIGVQGLRVVDSSVFPRITNGNLNGPTIVTAEKAADHILGREPLAADERTPWINPRWQISDR